MRNKITALLQLLLIGGLAIGLIGGCRKDKTTDEEYPIEENLDGEYMLPVNEILEEDWLTPAEMGGETESIYQTVYFDLDKSTVRKEFQPALEAIADDLKANPKRYLRCTGHCCDLGTSDYNFALGERRADSVRAYLAALGVDASRIHTLSKGEEDPTVANTDAERYLNRRVEFHIYPGE